MPTYPWLEFPLLVGMLAIVALILYQRMRPRTKEEDKSPRGIGARIIQLIALLILAPLIVILALEGKLSGDTVGALLGVAVGYTLSGVEKRL